MNFGVIIPDRGDRPRFTAHCNYLLAQQSVRPEIVIHVNEAPTSPEKDITKRYKIGYNSLRGAGLDCIFLWENDDFYCATYFETMLAAWEQHGKPDLFGPRHTEYYNIRIFEHFTMRHEQRTSAMNTLIRPDLRFTWPPDNEPYFDSWLYERAEPRLSRAVFSPEKPICLGIKHGVGLTGGNMHTDRLAHYQKHGSKDAAFGYLRSVVDPVSFEFYTKYFEKEAE